MLICTYKYDAYNTCLSCKTKLIYVGHIQVTCLFSITSTSTYISNLNCQIKLDLLARNAHAIAAMTKGGNIGPHVYGIYTAEQFKVSILFKQCV